MELRKGAVGGVGETLSYPPRPCPVCGSLQHSLIHRQRFEQFTCGAAVEGYEVVSCAGCGTCFASRVPDQSRFDEYYQSSSKYDLGASGGVLSSQDAERFASLAAFVSSHFAGRNSAVLDVGTAVGGFLLALRAEGFTSLHGVEPSPEAARVARDDHGLDVRVGGIGALADSRERFGFVSFVAVLEHLLDPVSAVRSALLSLEPGGMVLVQVPDAQAFARHIDAPYQQFSVEHVNYFTTGSLQNLMTCAGLAPVAQQRRVWRQSTTAEAPLLEALFRRPDNGVPPLETDVAGLAALTEYVVLSAEKERKIGDLLARLAESKQPLYVWGTGTHTLHLLQSTPLPDCDIRAFIDSNPHYAGAQLAGRKVLAPTDVTVDAPILVSSAVSQTEIASAARSLYGDEVRLILLY